MSCQAVMDGMQIVGSLVRIEVPPIAGRRDGASGEFGPHSLTEAELAVAVQVSQGMTNREAANHLYLSPHTIDFHLRQIFQKLSINSRVELTRVMLKHQGE
jgi:DNA-binding NarL/FixJ family response regulator